MSGQPAYQLKLTQNILSVFGEMTVHTVTDIQNSSQTKARFSIVNLSNIDKIDSAGLALLVSWFYRASKDQVKLTVQGMPDSLFSISELAGVDHLFK